MRFLRTFVLIFCLSSMSWEATLSLSDAAGGPGATVSLPLSLSSSGSQVSGVQWTLNYSIADIATLTVTADPSLVTAGKQLQCNTAGGQSVCLISGPDQTAITDGTIATATLTISSSTTDVSSTVSVGGSYATDPGGNLIATSASGATVTIGQPSTSVSGLTCVPASISVPGNSACTVTLAASAPAGGVAVGLGYAGNGVTISVPSSISVPAAATQAAFAAQAVSATSAGSATIVATLGTSSANFTLTVDPSAPAPPPDTTPPTTPANLKGVAVSTSQIDLSWTGSTDNVGVTAYLIERCKGFGCSNFFQIGKTAKTAYASRGLVAGTDYSYRVRAQDAAGNLSLYSNVVTVRTLRWH